MTPTNSLSSSDLSVSGEFSVDVNPYDRGNEDECSSHSSQDDVDSTTEYEQQHQKVEGKVARRRKSSSSMTEINDKSYPDDILKDVEILGDGHGTLRENGVANVLYLPDPEREVDSAQLDEQIWEPPEPDNPEDEIEDGVASVEDDDDDCCDGSKWSKSNFLWESRDESNKDKKLSEEIRRAMQDVAESKFKFILSQLIKSAGISSSTKEGENWLDIIARLSWEAASLLKPGIDGKPVDPNAYIKVKCIATGSWNESQVFKGLVFKKHAAHKHMATKYEHPRILLIQGVLGEPLSGLSSFKSMEQEKDVKPVVEIIEASQPNVMLVEKSVSRGVQESILNKGVTLVFDMKLHRLQRISRCIGSPIVSVDSLSSLKKLNHCDSFRIEKIVEEHNAVGEGEKKPAKTLMFIEGCPTHLGCTILLKGSHSGELKRVKDVVQDSVILAHHLILETSFLADRQTMFSTIFSMKATDITPENTSCVEETEKLPISPPGKSAYEAVDVPFSSGFDEQSIDIKEKTDGEKAETWDSYGDHVFSQEPYNPVIFTGFSSLSASISKLLGFVQIPESVPVSVDTDLPVNSNFELIRDSAEDTAENGDTKKPLLLDPGFPVNTIADDGDGLQTENDIEAGLESRSILVLVSKRNALKGILCDQSHFSHIMFYKHFDVPLEKFLRDMFNQGSRCQTCEELPEAHLYYYAHHNKQLTIQIKRILSVKPLSGEARGKIWMWSRCGKCKAKNGIRKSTKRVLISTAARSLSFGKFLELSFAQQNIMKRPSSCGHSFERDFLHFFGLGSMVAVLSYSQVTTYTVALPPLKLEASIIIKAGWLEKEFQSVFTKGIALFEEATSFLKKLRSQFTNSDFSHHCSLEDLSTVEEILKEERSGFEAKIKIDFDNANTIDDVSHKLLRLNRMRWELLLQALIWNYRLQSLVLSDRLPPLPGQRKKNEHDSKTVPVVALTSNENSEKGSDTDSNGVMDFAVVEGKKIPILGASVQDNDQMEDSSVPEDNSLDTTSPINNHLAVGIHSTNDQEPDKTILVTGESLDGQVATSNGSHILDDGERSRKWYWLPFEELRSKCIVDVEMEYLSKVDTVNNFSQENLETASQIITEESSRLHISLRDDDLIVSDYEDEISSLIACALSHLSSDENRMPLMRCIHGSLEGFLDKDKVSKQTVNRLSTESSTRFETLPPPEVLVNFGSAKSLGKSKYSVVCLYADDFRDLRKRCCSSELDYIASLSRCKPWDAKGGKSKSVFAKTLDNRFIVKEIKKTEYESFIKFAPEYFKYMKDCYELGNQTCLAKVLGIYQVTVRQPKGGKEIRHDLMVMENLSFGRKITRQYDLKGALHARFTATGDNAADDVLLDQNFVNDMIKSPLYVSKTSKRNLQRAVYNDTSFLNSINVMDYSLLVGVDDEGRELVCGIIDYLRQYTWDKQLETWVKSSLVVPRNVQPTVISPIDYKTRFRKFMKTHFLCVPDHWCNQEDSDDKSVSSSKQRLV